MTWLLFSGVNCSAPPDITDGSWDGGTLFGDLVSYMCNVGYDMVGKNTTQCQADGSWLPVTAPDCNSRSTHFLNNVSTVALKEWEQYRH